MKTMVAVVVLMVLGASSAAAGDIQGKWGIGAGVIGHTGEVSLIHGHSARSAWVFDVAVSGHDVNSRRTFVVPVPFPPTSSGNRNDFSILAGPGYRRFTRPAEEFSPYWDIHLRGSYAHEHSSGSGNGKTYGANGEFAFGLEYFTHWHFSVAAHTSLVTLAWSHLSEHSSFAEGTDNTASASIGISPSIFVRGYF